jgi:outer membrane protein assembly factor BamB
MPSRRRLLAAAGSLPATALAGCLGSGDAADGSGDRGTADGGDDWPMANFDPAGRSHNPTDAGPGGTPTERWTAPVGWPTGGRPVVADGTVYVPTATRLHALDAATGEVHWRVGADAPAEAPGYTSPAVHDGTAYVSVDDGPSLLALDAEDGSERWRFAPGDGGERRIPPIPTDVDRWRSLAAVTGANTVTLFDRERRTVRWSFDVFGRVTCLVARDPLVYVGTEGGEVYALYDGEGLWRRKLPGKITALATGDGSGDVFAGTFGGGVFRLRTAAHAGRTDWHAERGPVAHGAFVVAGDRVFGTDLSGMDALRADSGRTAWTVEGELGVPPAAAGDTLYLGGDSGVSAYDLGGGFGVEGLRIGAKRWSFPFEGGVRGGVTVADGAAFAVDGGGEDGESRLRALE